MKTCDNCTNKDWCLITRPDLYYEMLVFQGASVCPKYNSVEGDKKKMKVLKNVKIYLKSTNKVREFLTNKDVRLYKLNDTCGVLSIISVNGTKYVFNWDDILAIELQNVEEVSENGSSL